MNAIQLLNHGFGRHLIEQGDDPVLNAQKALSSAYPMKKKDLRVRISSGWAIIQENRAVMQFQIKCSPHITFSEKTRYEAFEELLTSWDGTPSLLLVFDKSTIPVHNLHITYDSRCVRICSPEGVETFNYHNEPTRHGPLTHKILWKRKQQ